MTLYDTTELARTGTRKFHACWAEVGGTKILIPPTVALELASDGLPDHGGGPSRAERRLASAIEEGREVPTRVRTNDEKQAWWAVMWRSPDSPYKLVELSPSQREQAAMILEQIPPECFPGAPNAYIDLHRDAHIVCETAAVGGRMLLTSNMMTIDHSRVNRWCEENGERLGFPAEKLIFRADEAIAATLKDSVGLKRGMVAALLANWDREETTPAEAVRNCINGLQRWGSGSRAPPGSEDARPETVAGPRPFGRPTPYTPVSGPVLSEMRSTLTPTFSSNVSPRFMNGVWRS